MRKNTDQNNSKYEHFLRSDSICRIALTANFIFLKSNMRVCFSYQTFSLPNFSAKYLCYGFCCFSLRAIKKSELVRRVINCSVFHKFIYNSFRDLLIFTVCNLYVWIGIFLLIIVICFILVVYDKLFFFLL